MAQHLDAAHAQRVADVGRQLRVLLSTRPAYLSRWHRVADRDPGPGAINYAAVSQVVIDYLVYLGERPAGTTARSTTDRVRLAVQGRRCTPTTLRTIEAAFEMTVEDVAALTAALFGADDGLLMDAVAAGSNVAQWRNLPTTPHTTLSLHEYHVLGPDRRPRRHRTRQRIQSGTDRLAAYPYRFDTDRAYVIAEEGGVAGHVKHIATDLWGVEIELLKPLDKGQTTLLVYETRFRYPSVPEPVFRRAALKPVHHVTITVDFDSHALPRRVWWVQSDVMTGALTNVVRVPVALDEGGVTRRIARLCDQSAGFEWEW